MKYYTVWLKDSRKLGCAEVKNTENWSILEDKGYIENWEPLLFEISEGEYTDYQCNDLGTRLCSTKLKDIIQSNRSENDIIQWLEASVILNSEKREYYILYLPEQFDVLNMDKSIFDDEEDEKFRTLVKPVLSEKLAAKHNFFHYNRNQIGLTISETIKKIFKKEKISGMKIESTPVAE